MYVMATLVLTSLETTGVTNTTEYYFSTLDSRGKPVNVAVVWFCSNDTTIVMDSLTFDRFEM